MPNPGRMISMTARKPTMTAAQRRGPTFSPSNGTENAATSSGETKPMAVASAKGM